MTASSMFTRAALFLALASGALAQDVNPRLMTNTVWPPPGSTQTSLTVITVTFSEPVVGVDAAGLLVNGAPALTVTNRGNTNFSYTILPPVPGVVTVGFDASHGIVDVTGNPFDETAPEHQWTYTLVDTAPPVVASTTPAMGATVTRLEGIEVYFNEPVTGVDAADLLVNDLPATNVIGAGAGPYVFGFGPPSLGTVRLAWAPNHGVGDLRSNAFAGGTWVNTLQSPGETGTVFINEFLANNANGLTNQFGEQEDWIELYNPGPATVDLLGWSLSDDPANPGQWTFPALRLHVGQYLLVFADGRNLKADGSTNLHTSFKLNEQGDYLGLFDASYPRRVVSEVAPQFPEQRPDYSYGLNPSNVWRYFRAPTPRAPNGDSTISDVAPMPHVSASRGLYDRPFSLVASCPWSEATLRYTMDGSKPTETNGQTYAGPLTITNTTVFRIAAFGSNYLPSRLSTHSYLFVDQVLRQPNNPPGYPFGTNVWSGYPADYEMDPEIVTNNPAAVRSSLLALPVLSLVASIDDLFGAANGIYTHPEPAAAQRYLWERECSAEFVLTNGQTGFQVDCGVRIQGNASRTPVKTPKHPFRLLFRGAYGPGRLEYPIYPDSPVQSFDTLVLRADFNNSWVHWNRDQRRRGNKVRDAWAKETQRLMNGVSGHSRPFHLFLNGLYWGVYDFGERVDAEFAASYLGGTAAQYDAIVSKPTEAIDGTLTAYNAMVALGRSSDMRQPSNYTLLQQRLDLPVFIEYMLLNFYGANADWGRDGNWNAVCSRLPGGTFKYVTWDGEQLLVDVNGNRVTSTDLPSDLHTNLVKSAEYRMDFADRIHRHCFNDGLLTPGPAADRWMRLAREVEPGMVSESARWGDYRRDVHRYETTADADHHLFTTNGFWGPEIERVRTNYFPTRTGIFLGQARAAGLYPGHAAPVFSQHGGRVPRGYALVITATNAIYYTTNGVDPRVPFTDALAPEALLYQGPVPIGSSLLVKARSRFGTNWSALNEAAFEVASLRPGLRVTEIMYNPPGGEAFEFLEFRNDGPLAVNLGGWLLDGADFTFPVDTVLEPGRLLVLANGLVPEAFAARYPGVSVFGWFNGRLDNGGERLVLKKPSGEIVLSVRYGDSAGWSKAADGQGYSLEMIEADGDPNAAAHWLAASLGGTPGYIPAAPTPPSVVINEVMADNAGAVTNAGTQPDWLELHNVSAAEVDLSDWSLSDDSNARKFVFPSNTVLAAGGFLVVWCDTNVALPGWHSGFMLERDGETVSLFNNATARVDAVTYGLQLPDYTLARLGSAWGLGQPTPGASNVAAAVASQTNLVINEWLANAVPGESDWLELFNISSQPVSLNGLSLGHEDSVHQIQSLSFLGPLGHVQLLADERSGTTHLDFKLAADGGVITLYDNAAIERNRVSYGPQAEGVSEGRLPDASSVVTNFVLSPSPGASNYIVAYAGPRLHEVMAANRGAVSDSQGATPDWIELLNPTATDFDLSGFRLGAVVGDPNPWVFPPGVLIGAHAHLVVWFDKSRAPSVTLEPELNTGRSLDGNGDKVVLLNALGLAVDAVEFGPQAPDLSLGLSANAWCLLATPTPGQSNSPPASLGSPTALRINEWLALSAAGQRDFLELHNTGSQPVQLSGLYLTDDLSAPAQTKFQVGPLSFIEAGGFTEFVADGDRSQGPNHLNFRLDAQAESLRLSDAGLAVLDTVYFGAQEVGVSEGRLPDGTAGMARFPASASPSESNYLPLPNAVINEVLVRASAPLEQAIELYNPTGRRVGLEGWYLSDTEANLKKLRLPDRLYLEAGGYGVLHENQFGVGVPGGFALDGVRGGRLYLSEADPVGNLTGWRAQAAYGAVGSGVSQGRFETCAGAEFVTLSGRSFGVETPGSVGEFRKGTGLPNAEPAVGPVVVNEIMYHPAGVGGEDNTLDEYVELHNVTGAEVRLYDDLRPTNVWRLRGGVDYEFAGGQSLGAGGYLLVVSFDPMAEPWQLLDFMARYEVPEGVGVVGPYRGKLDNGGERIELQRPEAPVVEGGAVPYGVVDGVEYEDGVPWPVAGDGDGASLQRRAVLEYGNDGANWVGAMPTAGRGNGEFEGRLPEVVVGPVGRGVRAGSTVLFWAGVCGSRPLSWQWRKDGVAITGQTNWYLSLTGVQAGQVGDYSVAVTNAAGGVVSGEGRLELMGPPSIVVEPVSQGAYAGTNLSLSVGAEGQGGLSYQWLKDGAYVTGATNAVLSLTNVQVSDSGGYAVRVANPVGYATSQVAVVTVVVAARITQQPLSQQGPPGTNVTFRVVAEGTGALRYQWWFDDKWWGHEPRMLVGATNDTLVVTNAQLADNGDYTVRITDDVSTVTSDSATLTVRVRPVFEAMPTNTVAPLGGEARFFAVASGTLPVSFRWRRNGATFTNGVIVSTPTNSTLTVTNVLVSYERSGFDVVLTNLAGQTIMASSNRAILTVWGPPVITVEPTNVTVWPGSNAVFSMVAVGMTNLYYQWRFNETNLPGKTNTTLSLTNVRAGAEGYYTVGVSNRDGVAVSRAALLTVLREVVLSQPEMLTNGAFRFLLQGNLDRSYYIDQGTNLVDWTTLGTLFYTNGWVPYLDATATNAPLRFYRARLVP